MVTFSKQMQSSSSGSSAKNRGNNKNLPAIIGGVIVVILLLGGGFYFWQNRGISIGGGDYQAVFLTNDQVYFGKIVQSNANEVVLRDVFYLILRRPAQVQGQTPESTLSGEPTTGQPKFILVRLGDREVHEPKDELRISRDQILFIEPLKEDSKVIRGIRDYKAKRAQEGQTTGE